MTEELDQSDGVGGKHASARQLAEQALAAQAAGDNTEADRLFAAAERADPDAVVALLQERADDAPAGADLAPQDDNEVTALSRTIEPDADAPSRAGVSGRGSGADNQGT